MQTAKPISTISYNTLDFLKSTCQVLVSRGFVSFFCFILHKGEDDEAGSKDHFHLYLELNKRVNTEDLRHYFEEPTRDCDKPLCVLPFQSSKFPDWYLYGMHHIAYLSSKHLERRFHYVHSDFVSCNEDYLLYLSRSFDMSIINPYMDMENTVCNGGTFDDYFRSHRVPIQSINAYMYAFDLIRRQVVDRDWRKKHYPKKE